MGTDNSASRLAAMLEQARQQPGRAAIEVWMQIFEVSDRLGVLQKAADLARLVDQVEAEVRALPEDEDPDHLLTFLPQIRNVVDALLYVGNVQMSHFVDQVTGEMVYSVASCARALRRNGRVQPLISDDSSKQLVEDVRAIIDDVVASDLPDDLKELLVDRLRGVEAALLSVRIGGYANVEKAMDALTFAAVRATKPGSEERAKAGSWLGRLWGKLSEHAQGAEAIASTAASTAEVVKAITGA
ncbi:hypothetical protein [Micromonospora chersina]|uniref:Uncharacterized protein n=1 Tax=Micromonospora chersina TaxID=47854 RepID=A0A1C6UR14_9ACTN|nr:hypothetical protein [Micromonospora chersina]SCL56487.1 hypothetical protein GA0070603_2218 [Micromonospora chersina]